MARDRGLARVRRRSPSAAVIATGTEELENGAVGESARGYAMMDAHRAWPPPREYGYLHSDTLRADDPAFRAARPPTSRTGSRRAVGGNVETRVSRDRHSALVDRHRRRSSSRIDELRAAVLAAAPRIPAMTIEETGDISASDRARPLVNRDLHRAELLSVPVTLIVLLFAFGAIVAALVPVLLALTAVDRGVRAARPDQPGVPDRRQRQDGGAADRDGRRRRLRALLRDPLARGAPPRTAVARGARANDRARRAARCSSRARRS